MEELIAEHRVILEVLSALEQAVEDAARTGATPAAFLRRLVTFNEGFIDRCHHTKEERCLIPCLSRRGVPAQGGLIEEILHEHELGRILTRDIVAALDRHEGGRAGVDDVLEPCRRYAVLLRQHIEKEHEALFPLSARVLSGSDQAETRTCFDHREDEMGHGEHGELIRLAEELAGRPR